MEWFSNVIDDALHWEFLNEPFYRWFVFLIAIGFAMGAWHGVLRHLEGYAA